MLLILSTLVVVVAFVIWARETLFAVPQCPEGAPDCAMRQGHFTGARLIGGTIALASGYLALWLAATRRAVREVWLPAFWLLPALFAGLAAMLVG